MKKQDLLGVLYFLLYAAVVFFFPFAVSVSITGDRALVWDGFDFCGSFSKFTGLKNFGDVVALYPYTSGFLKVGLLATFGEMLKTRGRTGSWKMPALLPKFAVWGFFGVLFTYVFTMFANGVGSLMNTPLWPVGVDPHSLSQLVSGMNFWQTLAFALSTSFWMNLIFCYPMMLGHEWFNTVIMQKRFIGGEEFLSMIDKHVWGSFMLKSIVIFWIPAHTITFCLPPNYRVLMSALLSLALGFILTVKPKKHVQA